MPDGFVAVFKVALWRLVPLILKNHLIFFEEQIGFL